MLVTGVLREPQEQLLCSFGHVKGRGSPKVDVPVHMDA